MLSMAMATQRWQLFSSAPTQSVASSRVSNTHTSTPQNSQPLRVSTTKISWSPLRCLCQQAIEPLGHRGAFDGEHCIACNA